MRLSDAIREGCKTTTQEHGSYIERNDAGEPVRACALGAAMIGVGDNDYTNAMFELEVFWPELDTGNRAMRHPCPAPFCPVAGNLFLVITHLNDTHCWTREDIADFIDTLSIDLTPAPVVREAVPA